MGPTRFPYGVALGFANQFYSNRGVSSTSGAGINVVGTAGDISGSTAPTVTIGGLFYTNNTNSLTITNFLLDATDSRAVNYEGKIIRVFFIDTATQIDNNASLILSSTNNLIGANNSIELVYSSRSSGVGQWYEIDRTYNNRTEWSLFSISGASSINVDAVRVAVIQNTGSITTWISALSNGQVGQEITMMRQGSNVVNVQTGGNILIAGTNAYTLNASGAYKFIKWNSALWRMITIGTAGNA